MSAVTVPEPVLEAGVLEFLRAHNIVAEFQKACEAAATCFPEMQGLRVWLLDDPDEENHTWVGLNILMPTGHSFDLLHDQEGRFHELMLEQISKDSQHSFALMFHFATD